MKSYLPKGPPKVEVWEFHVNYGFGDGWEHEGTELTREAMRVNRKAYREDCPYPLKIKRRFIPASEATE